jgi:hypothetical protein
MTLEILSRDSYRPRKTKNPGRPFILISLKSCWHNWRKISLDKTAPINAANPALDQELSSETD